MVVMMVMVKMVKIENGKKEKYSIIYNIYIYLYYSVKMALPKIDFDQNDHDHFDHGINFFFVQVDEGLGVWL